MKVDNKKIYLYHGSDVRVKEIDLNKCREGKDFGKGFYLSYTFKQANSFSKTIQRRNNSSNHIVSEYIINNLNDLRVYEFKQADNKWLDCVTNYRSLNKKKTIWDEYDVLIGKIADDDTSKIINLYMVGAYGEVGSKSATDFAVKMLETNRLEKQICFKTKKALKHLEYLGYYKNEP